MTASGWTPGHGGSQDQPLQPGNGKKKFSGSGVHQQGLKKSLSGTNLEPGLIAKYEIMKWSLCLMCCASLSLSGVLFYRELKLEERISRLELQQEVNRAQRMGDQLDVQVPAVAELEEQLLQRIRKEMQREIDEEVQKKLAMADAGLFRAKRDIVECNCPPGERK